MEARSVSKELSKGSFETDAAANSKYCADSSGDLYAALATSISLKIRAK